MSKITNTSKAPRIDWLFGGNHNAIYQQEAEGQKELVNSEQLPIKGNNYPKIDVMAQYEKMGIVAKVEDPTDLFLSAKLPEGWKKEGTGHSMWSNLLDDKGRVRATIFYKAAFYDRDAFINFTRRYNTEGDYSVKGEWGIFVKDANGDILFKTDKIKGPEDAAYWKKQDEMNALAKDFLDKNFPDWNDINAYWD